MPHNIVNELDTFSQYSRSFCLEELLDSAHSGIDTERLRSILIDDARFIRLTDGTPGEELFVPAKTLFLSLCNLSVRLAQAGQGTLEEHQLSRLMNSLRPDARWDSVPPQIVEFGQRFGLMSSACTAGSYVFPIAHILSFMTPGQIKLAGNILTGFAQRQRLEPPSCEMLLKSVQEGLLRFPPRTRRVIQFREGILEARRMTLQQIGVEFTITRERVRQIEAGFWSRVRHPKIIGYFLEALLLSIMSEQGSLIVRSDSTEATVRSFIAKCMRIPQVKLPNMPLVLLGVSLEGSALLESTGEFTDDIEPEAIAIHLASNNQLCLIGSDLTILAERIALYHKRRLKQNHRVYLALRACGRPAHYANVTEVYNSMFPHRPLNEHAVHARLSEEVHGVVWIGTRGTFALKEWGYEHPPIGLFDAVTQIVQRRYEETGKPVPYEVIVAEIGKYRQIAKPASVSLAIALNLDLKRVQGNCFVPKPVDEGATELTDDEVDRALQQFEKELAQTAHNASRSHYEAMGKTLPSDVTALVDTTPTEEEEKQAWQSKKEDNDTVHAVESSESTRQRATRAEKVTESEIYGYPADFFFSLAHWAKEQEKLNSWERRLIFSMGIYRANGWQISEKQERQAIRIISYARLGGFSEASEQNKSS